MSSNKVKIGSFLKRRKYAIEIENSIAYKRITIKTKHQGIFLRDTCKGSLIGTKLQFTVQKGQFLLSKIDARLGAFGIVPEFLDGGIITGNFWAFDVDRIKVNVDWFNLFTSSGNFYEICNEASSGTTHRKYLDETKFLNFEIELPSVNEQNRFIKKYQSYNIIFKEVFKEINNQQTHLQLLRQAILQEAVQGKLSEQGFAGLKDSRMKGGQKILSSSNHKNLSADNEDAATLLQRIKAEKQKLIAAGKLKKEKELPPIAKEEIPFELPKGWVWCRLGEIIEVRGGKRLPNGHQLTRENTGQIYVRVTDMQNGTIDDSDLHYVKPATFKQIKNYIIKKEDLYLVIVGSTIGKSGIVPETFDGMSLTENAVKLKPILVDKMLINHFLKSQTILEQFYDKTKQVGQPKLAIHRIQSSLFPLPPLSEQHRIVAKVQQLLEMVSELEHQVSHSQAQAQQLLQAVLKEAFSNSGKPYNENEMVTMAADSAVG